MRKLEGIKWSLKGIEITEWNENGEVVRKEKIGWRCSCEHASEAEHLEAQKPSRSAEAEPR